MEKSNHCKVSAEENTLVPGPGQRPLPAKRAGPQGGFLSGVDFSFITSGKILEIFKDS